MGTKKDAMRIYFMISMIILIVFVSAGILIKTKILDKMPKKAEEEKKLIEKPKDPAKAISSAIFGLATIIGLILLIIFVIYKISGAPKQRY